jgi:hypothetical protein
MDRREEIAKVAYELYMQGGRIDGKDVEHWFEAERIVTARYAEQKAAPARQRVKKAAAGTAPRGRKAATGSKTAAKKTVSKARTT